MCTAGAAWTNEADASPELPAGQEKKKAGFTDEKIEEFREVFTQFVKDLSGEIDNVERLGRSPVARLRPRLRVRRHRSA